MEVEVEKLISLFQFLLVRLKAIAEPVFYNKKTVFQFLLVRLKEFFDVITPTTVYISIPTGTIKSFGCSDVIVIPQHFNSYWYD